MLYTTTVFWAHSLRARHEMRNALYYPLAFYESHIAHMHALRQSHKLVHEVHHSLLFVQELIYTQPNEYRKHRHQFQYALIIVQFS